MAEPPKYTFKGGFNNHPVTQKCAKCNNYPNTTVHWSPPSGTPSYAGRPVGFSPAGPFNPNRPVYHNPHGRPTSHYSPQPPPYSEQYPIYYHCSCGGNEYRQNPTVVPKPSAQPPKGGLKPYYWVDTSSRSGVPSTALHGGHDIDGSQIFVGRAFHEGDWIPAKVIPSKNVAYVAYGGGEHAKHQYQVLCEQRFDWVPNSGGHIPPGAVEGGRTADGEPLYVGRVHHEGAVTVGKVHPSHGVCYIPFDGREVGHHSYEILILRS